MTQPTIDKLYSMKLSAMARAFSDQLQSPDMASLSFEERFGLIVDYQVTDLENRRMLSRLKNAKLRLSAAIEDLDFRQGRGLDRSTIMSLARNHWVKSHHNILVTGLNYPIVPKGDEEIRLQVSANQTEKDIDYLLERLKSFDGAITRPSS